ncbi:MAG: 6,7-dimethyl-8-ribityllumazine synthase [Candidatus Kapaibacteriales bacterium]
MLNNQNDINTIRPELNANGLRFAVIVTDWNEFITHRLRDGAIETLKKLGCQNENITLLYCPGAYEIPVVAKKCAESGKYDAIIALGAVIRGATPHFDIVAGQSASGLMSVMTSIGVPCINGILTTDTIEQAIERAGTKAGNKGSEASSAAVETVNLLKKI